MSRVGPLRNGGRKKKPNGYVRKYYVASVGGKKALHPTVATSTTGDSEAKCT
jgi:hypothetical protein